MKFQFMNVRKFVDFIQTVPGQETAEVLFDPNNFD